MTFTYNENFIYDNVETLMFVVVLLRNTLISKINSTTQCTKKEIAVINSVVLKQNCSYHSIIVNNDYTNQNDIFCYMQYKS
jgi:hypothetical protein